MRILKYKKTDRAQVEAAEAARGQRGAREAARHARATPCR